MSVRNPVKTALYLHEASKSACSCLTPSMVEQDYFLIGNHCRNVKEACVEEHNARLLHENALLEDL